MTEKTFTLYFNPSSTITAFELASILLTMPLGPGQKPIAVAGITATEEQWKRVPPPLRQYFVKDSPWGERDPANPPEQQAPGPVEGVQTTSTQTVEFVSPPVLEERPLPKGPSPQPPRPVPSFYHNEGVDSLYPDGMQIVPTPEGA
jgi:hypothetical protein